ncbi:hypothetical protein HN643_00275 [Candidatus Falkowbacteria bacterium]|nr:hypothetical protein [Candidatus Falkowbacteria bacterium]MBT5502872.1 hypothetical protein [Candidatus Falkowbacteria bacterium]MBT6573764.1 hypothetical protein [Candidatus Falkowbacteria bacterium]MBT7500092.1 hypothetical protein [Candidatus Falkowbacteria bacterium]
MFGAYFWLFVPVFFLGLFVAFMARIIKRWRIRRAAARGENMYSWRSR